MFIVRVWCVYFRVYCVYCLGVVCLLLGHNVFIVSNCTCFQLIIIFYIIIFGSLNFSIFVHTCDDVLYSKCLLCIYVYPEDDPRRPKHVGKIIMTKQIFMHEYLQLVGINKV